jgi:hypothetical protein
MNERIKELANQAYGITDAKPFHPSALIHLEKFAKLIVQECMDQCFTDTDAENIAKHFGVDILEEE